MQRIELELELLTPAFLGGAEPRRAEWRAPSIRGQLRWWLRAFVARDLADPAERIARVRAVETALFGSTQQPSAVTVQVTALGRQARGTRSYPRLAYLAYGCVDPRSGEPTRGVLPETHKARLVLGWRRFEPEHETALRDALWAWLQLGGLGARCRNGFGSLAASGEGASWVGDLAPESVEAFRMTLVRRLGSGLADGSEENEWSHLSATARVLVSRRGHRDPLQALAAASADLAGLRHRYGAADDPRQLGGMKLARRDLVWVRYKSPTYHQKAPDCGGFGLPLPYHSPDGSIRKDEVLTWGPPTSGDGRRASSLLLHVGRFGRSFHTVWTHLPARLVPPGEDLRFKNDPHRPLPVTEEQRNVIRWTLDHFVAQEHLQEVWP